MTAVRPYRSSAPVRRGDFAQLLYAEWTKFRTVRGWVTGMIVAVLVIVVFGLFAAGGGVKASASKACPPGMSSADCRSAVVSLAPPENTIALYLIGTFAGLIAVAVVATMFMSAEYRRGLIRTTLAASPARGRVLAAKAIVIGAVAFVAGLAGAAGAVIFATDLAHHRGLSVLTLRWPTELRVIAGTAALIAVAAVFTLAIAVIVRRSASTLTIAIVTIVFPYFLSVSNGGATGVTDFLLRVTPAAAFALQQPTPQYYLAVTTPATGFFPLAPWAGFAVLCGWTALALVLAAYLLRRRDA
jgi:ABC-type transport system involved in multi-copper enzyme maturation permease subunit